MNEIGKKTPGTLRCPRCRIELRTVEGSDGLLYRCAGGHGYMALSLLEEQSQLAERMLSGVEASVETQLAIAGELAGRAEAGGQRHLLPYLDRIIDAGRRTLRVVRQGGGSQE